jgi:DNA polymerase III sliding clamp (beta) subunit (PCNA family)
VSAVDDLVKLLAKDSTLGTVSVGESENHIVFRVGADMFIANKLTVTYPDVQNQMLGPAQNNNDELHVDREELLQVIKRVRINADPESSAIMLRLAADEMTVASRDKSGNACEESLNVGWTATPRDIVVNHKFFTEMLQMYDGKTCKLLLAEDKKSKAKKAPIMLRDEATGMIGLIQQMRPDFVLN